MIIGSDSLSNNFDHIDMQTDVPKRHLFEEILGREWSKAVREAHPIAVLFIEIDFFDNLYEDYDGSYVDLCLKKITESIVEITSRPNDFIAHYEEGKFAAILSSTDINGAEKVGNAIIDSVLKLKLENRNSPFKSLTVSVGASSFIPIRGLSSSQLINHADAALDNARWNGHNQFRIN